MFKDVFNKVFKYNIKRGYILENILKELLSGDDDFKFDLKYPGWKPDLVIMELFIVELKIGSNFDTKKGVSEVKKLQENIQKHYPYAAGMIVCWAASDEDLKLTCWKNENTNVSVITGRRFCEHYLDLDFDEVNKKVLDKEKEFIQEIFQDFQNQGIIKDLT